MNTNRDNRQAAVRPATRPARTGARRRWSVWLAALLALALVAAACGDDDDGETAPEPPPSTTSDGGGEQTGGDTGTGSDSGETESDGDTGTGGADEPPASTEPITIWIDPVREPAVQTYQELFPDRPIKYEFVDRVEFPAQVLLFNTAGEGWPDVIFAEPELIAQAADDQHDYALDLSPLVSDEVLGNFYPGGMSPCIDGDRILCLRNDIAHMVMWYNAPLLDELGLELPQTWEEYEALGERLAAERPGTLIGACGDEQCLDTYFWPSQCPVQRLDGKGGIFTDLSDSRCVRAAEMVDNLLESGVMSKVGPFDPGFVEKIQAGEWLLFPAANWYGEFVFGGSEDSLYYQSAEGQLGIGLLPRWSDSDKAWVGARGGAAWAVSRHSDQPEAAYHFVEWVTTAPEYQGTAGGFPAYQPAAEVWEANVAEKPLYAENPFPTISAAAELLDPSWGTVRYSYLATFTDVVISEVQSDGSVLGALPELERQLKELQELGGYTRLDSEPPR